MTAKIEEILQTQNFRSPQDKAVLNLIYTGNLLAANFNHALKAYDLSEPQFNVLRILRGQKGNPLNLMDISSRMIHPMSNATRLVEKLRLKGYVERVMCEDNRRKVEITITQSGLDLLERLAIELKEELPDYRVLLTEEEAEQLSNLVDKLRQ